MLESFSSFTGSSFSSFTHPGIGNAVNSQALSQSLLQEEEDYSDSDENLFGKKSCCEKMGKLRLILQDYFYPYTEKNGWLFTSLLFSLVVICIHTLCSSVFIAVKILQQYEVKVGIMGAVGVDFMRLLSTIAFYGIPFAFCSALVFIYCWRGVVQNSKQWLMLSCIALTLITYVFLLTGNDFVASDLINAMVDGDATTFQKCIWVFIVGRAVRLPILYLKDWTIKKLKVHWREYLTTKYIESIFSSPRAAKRA